MGEEVADQRGVHAQPGGTCTSQGQWARGVLLQGTLMKVPGHSPLKGNLPGSASL